MKHLACYSILFFCFIASALGSGGPFGLEKGMSLEEVAVVLGETPTTVGKLDPAEADYIYTAGPTVFGPEFPRCIMLITPEAGLSNLKLMTGPMISGQSGADITHSRIRDRLILEYGLPVTDYLSPLSSRPLDIRGITSRWEQPEKDGLDLVTLDWFTPSNVIQLYFRFDNWEAARKEIDSSR